MIAVNLPRHTSCVNTTLCQPWCQTCGEAVVSCFPFGNVLFIQVVFFSLSAKNLQATI